MNTGEDDDGEADDELLEITVDAASEGTRLDRFLAGAVPGRSRALIQKHIAAGAVTIGGDPPKRGASTALASGAIVRYVPPPPETIDLLPEDIPLSILYEDQHLLIADKPAGLVVHPAAGHWSGTLVNAVLHHLGRGGGTAAKEARPGIVHRLDRDTTGAIVIAKNESIHDALGRAFRERRVEKRYIAVTIGVPKERTATIDTFYGRHPRERKRFSSRVTSGKRAITRYTVAEAFAGAARLEVELETGRTHQIRVHLADRGHPLIGDLTYGRKLKLSETKSEVVTSFDRPALHAHRLAFDHPIGGRRIEAVAPIPADLDALLAELRLRPEPRR